MSVGKWNFIAKSIAPIIVLLGAGCATQLAPKYDQAIADGLTAANKDIQTLFVTVENGVTKDTYSTRAQTYISIIGSLNALEIQAKLRPIPDSIELGKVNSILSASGLGQLTQDKDFTNIPSVRSIHDTADTIAHMQKADESAGLRGEAINAFRNQATTFLSQAIAYETFIKR